MNNVWGGLVVMVLVACGGGTPGKTTTTTTRDGCVPGASETCACDDGRSGAQVCSQDATYEACRCTGATSGPGDAGSPEASVDAAAPVGVDIPCTFGQPVAGICPQRTAYAEWQCMGVHSPPPNDRYGFCTFSCMDAMGRIIVAAEQECFAAGGTCRAPASGYMAMCMKP